MQLMYINALGSRVLPKLRAISNYSEVFVCVLSGMKMQIENEVLCVILILKRFLMHDVREPRARGKMVFNV